MTLFKQLRATGRYEITLLLFLISIFCFVLSVFRYVITDTKTFLFLNWNLFLAFIPWLISTIIVITPKLHKQPLSIVFLLISWLLFFPNSPYILTDLFHLKHINSAPIWFDLILILSFAWAGLFYGFVSLLDIEILLSERFSQNISKSTVTFFLFASTFGIYLGRFLRWNSWDVIQNPIGLLYDIGSRFTNPLAHSRTWGLTILMGILLNFMYWSIRLLKNKRVLNH